MQKYFYRPENSRVRYVRLVPPKHIKHIVREPEFRKSTGQTDSKLALPVGMRLVADKFAEWNAIASAVEGVAAKPTMLDPGLIQTTCAARLYSWMLNDDEERAEGLSDEQLVDSDNFCKLNDAAMRAALAQGPKSSRWAQIVESVVDWTETMGDSLELTDPSCPSWSAISPRSRRTAIGGSSAATAATKRRHRPNPSTEAPRCHPPRTRFVTAKRSSPTPSISARSSIVFVLTFCTELDLVEEDDSDNAAQKLITAEDFPGLLATGVLLFKAGRP